MKRPTWVKLTLIFLKVILVLIIGANIVFHSLDLVRFINEDFNSRAPDNSQIMVLVWFACTLLNAFFLILVVCFEDTISATLFIILSVVLLVINVMYYQKYLKPISNILEFVQLLFLAFYTIIVCIVDAAY